jgi:hypothetical protein
MPPGFAQPTNTHEELASQKMLPDSTANGGLLEDSVLLLLFFSRKVCTFLTATLLLPRKRQLPPMLLAWQIRENEFDMSAVVFRGVDAVLQRLCVSTLDMGGLAWRGARLALCCL